APLGRVTVRCTVAAATGYWQERRLDVDRDRRGAAHRLRAHPSELDEVTRNFLVAVADAAAARWQEQDQGIWEVRGDPRDFLYSKLMCWVALDCAIDLADILHAHDRIDEWAVTREQIRDAILQRGWSEKAAAFTQSFGS